MTSNLNHILEDYKYKGVSLEATISLVYSDFNIPLPPSLNQDLVEILVDYKFKVNYRLVTAVDNITKLVGRSSRDLRPVSSASLVITPKPVFNTFRILEDLKVLGILNKLNNFELEYKTTTGVFPKEYIFELKAAQHPSNTIGPNAPSIFFAVPLNPNTNWIDNNDVSEFLYKALVQTVEDYKLGNLPKLIYNGLSVNIHYTENLGRIPVYEIYSFSKIVPGTNYLNNRFLGTP
jgi:hypothetical protein